MGLFTWKDYCFIKYSSTYLINNSGDLISVFKQIFKLHIVFFGKVVNLLFSLVNNSLHFID
jgi:hypothetical protein